MKLSKNSTLEKINKYKKVILGCIVTILVMLGLFVFLNQSYIQKFIYEERLNQMDEDSSDVFESGMLWAQNGIMSRYNVTS